MNVFLSLFHLYTKFHGQIHLTLEVTKKTNLRCIWTITVVRKFVFFVIFRVRWIWPLNFIYRWGKLRSIFMIFFQNFLKLFFRFAWVCTEVFCLHQIRSKKNNSHLLVNKYFAWKTIRENGRKWHAWFSWHWRGHHKYIKLHLLSIPHFFFTLLATTNKNRRTIDVLLINSCQRYQWDLPARGYLYAWHTHCAKHLFLRMQACI